jgi:hypothetical protein
VQASTSQSRSELVPLEPRNQGSTLRAPCENAVDIKHKFPSDLARIVHTDLMRGHKASPPLSVLSELFQTLYWASLKTEESQPVRCHIVYLNPDKPDPNPPQRIRKDRWICVPFGERIPFSIPDLVKIARASDPRTSSFAVYCDKNRQLYIWGLVDQGNRYFEYVNFDADGSFERPGLFQVSISGIGHIIAYHGFERIAELAIDSLITESYDVLRLGPIKAFLQPGINRFVASIADIVGPEVFHDRDHWSASFEDDWIATLCRLLLRIRNHRHGGALLITPDNSHEGLNLKYKATYDRLRIALEHQALHTIQKTYAEDIIYDLMEYHDSDTIPIELYLAESTEADDLEDSTSELDGCLWFVSLLARVDGLVLMSPDLEVQGFGVEILESEPPTRAFRATTATATQRSLQAIDYYRFGTRHRSMMRYCFHHPDSLGFVVSQDGEVRAVTRVGENLVMWENIRLQMDTFVKRRIGPKRLAGSKRVIDPRPKKST